MEPSNPPPPLSPSSPPTATQRRLWLLESGKVVCACMLAGLGIGQLLVHYLHLAPQREPSFGAAVLAVGCFQGAGVLGLLWAARWYLPDAGLAAPLGLYRPRGDDYRLALAAAVAAVALVLLTNLLLFPLLTRWGYRIEPNDLLALLQRCPWWQRLVLLALTVGLVPLAEELLFRLLLYELLATAARPALAAVGTALVFAALHLTPEAIPGLFLLGLFLQRLRQSSGGLVVPILTHAGFNGLMVALSLCLPN